MRRLLCGVFAAALLWLPAAVVMAAPPQTVLVEGVLLAGGGSPAADGTYAITFALYDAATGGKQLWVEGPTDVAVIGGRFAATLGAAKAIVPATLAGGAAWLGVKVGSEPELPRKALHAVPFAVSAASLSCANCVDAGAIADGAVSGAKLGVNYAGSATKGGAALDLKCTGCVSVAELAFDGDVDLGGHSLKAGSGTFAGDVVAKTMTATAFVGDGSKLTGLALPSGACAKAGEVVKGINADGSLICVPAMDAKNLPADGLDEVSGGLLGTQFKDVFGGAKLPVAIPDNTGASAIAIVDIADLGTMESVRIELELANTDLSKVSVQLLPPDDKQKGFLLCDPCGDKDVKSLKTSYPDKSKPKDGDLATLIGKSPKGSWTLKVLDSGFCLPQAPGNAALCNTTEKTDGAIVAFSVEVGTLSKVKVGAFAPIQLFRSKDVPYPCDPVVEGSVFYDLSNHRLRFCDGGVWRSLADACGNGIIEPGEQCDDGNNTGGDGCSEICLAAPGTAKATALASCDAIAKAWKQDGSDAPSGAYWLDPDGDGKGEAFQTYCEFSVLGGGWAMLFNLDSGDNKRHVYGDDAFWTGAGTEGDLSKPLASGSKSLAYSELGGKELLVVAHSDGKIVAWGAYDLLPAAVDKPLMTLMKGGEATISSTRKAQFGATGAIHNPKRPQPRYGDPFVDVKNGEALVVNKQSGWGANANKARLMTTANNGDYGHTFSGLGGYHIHSGWGMNFESAPIVSYCDCTSLYGSDANLEPNGQGTTLTNNGGCHDPSAFKFLPIDIAVFVR